MKYLIDFNNNNVKLTLTYDSVPRLIALHLEGDFDEEQYKWIMDRIPLKPDFKNLTVKPKIKVSTIPEDLSFDRFWDEYNIKDGGKKRSEKLWNRLSETDKHCAIKYIKPYFRSIQKREINPKNPDTYLRQEAWNN